jgi:hypothetical protein
MAEERLVIPKQLVAQAGVGHIREFHLALARGCRHAAALADIPHAASCRLHHLVGHLAVLPVKPPAEHHRGVIHRLGHFVAAQLAVVAMRQKYAGRFKRVHTSDR